MTIEQQIINAAQAAVKELYGQEVPEKMVQLQKTKKEFEGNLTLVVFPFLKISRKKPDETAREIGEYIKQNCEAIADFNAVGGFLNLVIDKKAWLALLNEMNLNEKFGEKPVTEASPLVMIEYSSPNTNKPFRFFSFGVPVRKPNTPWADSTLFFLANSSSLFSTAYACMISKAPSFTSESSASRPAYFSRTRVISMSILEVRFCTWASAAAKSANACSACSRLTPLTNVFLVLAIILIVL